MTLHVPSERKFEVYHAVETQRLSRREAARRFKLSPTRVQQMVTEVGQFVLEHGSRSMLNADPEQIELSCLRLGYEKLCYYEMRLMRQWTALEGSSNVGAAVRVLQAAARMAIEQTKLAGRIGKVQKEMIEEGTFEPPQHTYRWTDDDEEDTSDDAMPALEDAGPPEEDCTDDGFAPTAEEQQLVDEVIASLGPSATSDQIFRAIMQRGRLGTRGNTPVQSEDGKEGLVAVGQAVMASGGQ